MKPDPFVLRYKTIGSTNTEAISLAEDGAAHGTVVVARQQTGGRGRDGRSFASPPGGLYFSLILRPRLAAADFPLLTLAVGVGIHGALAPLAASTELLLKWPNDLFLADRKLAGVLTQASPCSAGSLPHYVIAGVGINLNTDPALFPSSLRGSVISLYDFTGHRYDHDQVLQSVVASIVETTERLGRERAAVLEQWRAVDYLRQKKVEYTVNGKQIDALAVGLADDGQYLVRDASGRIHSVVAGDIRLSTLQRP